MPFDFRLFREMFRLALHEPMSPTRKRVVWLALVVLPLMALGNAICFALDRVLFPGFRRVPIHAPIFVIGHARSGTSLMHRLLSADPRFSWFAMYELFLPSLLQRKLVRFLGRCDGRFLGGKIDRRIKAWEDRNFATGRQMHPMSLTGPEEDEFLMAVPFSSSTVTMIFPYMRELLPYSWFDRELPERTRRRVMTYYRECVRRQLYLNGSDRIHLSKNPVFSEKVKSLLETFPDARFVVMVRHPYETIPSILKMMSRNWKASDCPPERIQDSLEVLFETSISAYRYPLEVLDERPDVPCTVVRYQDLVENPKRAVESVYEAFDIPLPPEVEKSLAEEQARAGEYHADHRYSLEEFGISRDDIRNRLSPLFDRFGWEE